MADDWIKMRHCLWSHPRVVTLLKRLSVSGVQRSSVSHAHVLGAIYRAWCLADLHADPDGTMHMSAESLDELTETPGLAAGMEAIGWLRVVGTEAVQFLEYQEHNGQTAKSRAMANRRLKRHRKARNADETLDRCKNVSREEKRREEFPPNPPEGGSGETAQPSSPPPGPAAGEDEVLLTYPCDGPGQRTWTLTAAHVASWAEAFPALDVLGECRKALAWVEANPSRRKTPGGMPRFLVSWLGRAQNQGPAGGRGPPGGRRETVSEIVDRVLGD